MRGCRGKLYTNLDATIVIQNCEHADGRRVDPHTLYRQPNELQQLAAGDLTYWRIFSIVGLGTKHNVLRPFGTEIPTKSGQATESAAHCWANNNKSGAQLLMYHSPTNDILIFTYNAGVRLLAQSNFWCRDGTFKISHPGNRSCLTFLRLIIDEQGKTESVVQQMDDGYTRETGFVTSSAAYRVQEATAYRTPIPLRY
ncbi:hypothetical protein T02_3628 [Trichinella nativa]|uniref:Uncharacterized protein n=1 Tax=Trichinella nativa TaxID=6335 RepID=A0A0V1KP75_9BILA|nr:hypothetical protein T02_3628 [Trichinella nativa]